MNGAHDLGGMHGFGPINPEPEAEEPAFHAAWEKRLFSLALAVRLSEAGCFTWSEWVAVLGQEIKAAQAQGDPDLGGTYYRHWLNALERICIDKGLVEGEDVHRRTEAWRRAYLRTPHGQPISLSATCREAPRHGLS
jgi:nitrile hydratase accessory protein